MSIRAAFGSGLKALKDGTVSVWGQEGFDTLAVVHGELEKNDAVEASNHWREKLVTRMLKARQLLTASIE
jgi:hypothetical protein